MQDHGKPVYKVKNVSLNALCDYYGASINPIKDQVKAVYRRDQRFWARRPLTIDMICYAAADVISLVPNIYEAMKRWIIWCTALAIDDIICNRYILTKNGSKSWYHQFQVEYTPVMISSIQLVICFYRK